MTGKGSADSRTTNFRKRSRNFELISAPDGRVISYVVETLKPDTPPKTRSEAFAMLKEAEKETTNGCCY